MSIDADLFGGPPPVSTTPTTTTTTKPKKKKAVKKAQVLEVSPFHIASIVYYPLHIELIFTISYCNHNLLVHFIRSVYLDI